MKVAERVNKFRDMSADELQQSESDLREQLFKLRLQWAMGQSETLKKMRELRKDRARIQTFLRQKEKGK
jgi:large subunit ribosomal protein L29